MRFLASFVAALLPLTVIGAQIPIIEKDRLSKVISESLFLLLHRKLVEIDSVTNKEYEIGKWLEKLLEGHHFKVITQEVPPREGSPESPNPRLNVYAYPDPKYYKGPKDNKHKKHVEPPRPKVLLTSHIDTVPPFFPYTLSYDASTPGEFNRSNILISGRGSVDAKASVAAQITAAMDFLTTPPSPDFSPTEVALLFVVDEESGGTGMRHFSASELYRATNVDYKAVIFGEPTERKLVSGHKGIFMLKLDARGKAAHSGYPWLGTSANSMILPALSVLDSLDRLPVEDGGLPGSEKFGRTTINVGLIRGGEAANVVPASAHAEITFRLASDQQEESRRIVEAAVKAVDPEGHLHMEFTQGYGPVNFDTDVDGFETIVVNYGTDAPGLDVRDGVKRYLYGPGTIFVAHGPDEALTVGELEAGLEGYKALLKHALAL